MQWEKLNFYTPTYFEKVHDAIITNSFINHENPQLDIIQYGIGIIERADLMLKEANDKEFIGAVVECLLVFFDKYSDYFVMHLQGTLGAFPYSGLLKTQIEKIKYFWTVLAERCPPYSNRVDYRWLALLIQSVLEDPLMADKMTRIHAWRLNEVEDKRIKEILIKEYASPIDHFQKLGIL